MICKTHASIASIDLLTNLTEKILSFEICYLSFYKLRFGQNFNLLEVTRKSKIAHHLQQKKDRNSIFLGSLRMSLQIKIKNRKFQEIL